jgi:hypothetical protein
VAYLRAVNAKASFVVLLAAAGCTDEDYEGQVSNQGTLCVRPAGAEAAEVACPVYAFEAERSLELEVDFGICLSSTCDHDATAKCSATVEGSVVTVKAQGSYVHEGDECSDDCGFLVARCELEPLPAGDYEFVYAGQTLTLSLPSERADICTDSGMGCCDGDGDCDEGTCSDENYCVAP